MGIAILGLGLHSHYQTAWNKTVFINLDPDSSWGELDIKLYKICDFKDIEPEWRDKSCPSINMEHFFIAMIIICFLMSLITFTVEVFVHVQDYPFRFLDMGYHGASAILLAVSGSMYILSAIQISNFFDLSNMETEFWREQGYVFKKHEKIATGVSKTLCFK